MDQNHEVWNRKHKELRQALGRPHEELSQAKQLFLDVHAPLHAQSVSFTEGWNVEEEIWAGLTEAEFRLIAPGEEHSIAWCLWHLARIEDATMNVLVADRSQVITEADWARRLHSPVYDTGNCYTVEDVSLLSEKVAFEGLRTYRSAVGQRTREVVFQLGSVDVKRKTPKDRLQRLLDDGTVLPRAADLLDYWEYLTVAGLLLMPPTRHNLVHLNECLRLKKKAQKVLQK